MKPTPSDSIDHKRRALATLGLAALAPAAWAQSRPAAGAWSDIVAAANKEGKVVFYAAVVGPVMDRLKEDFNKLYPNITVEGSRIIGGAGNAKLDAERQQGLDGADIAVLTEVAWVDARAKEGSLVQAVGPSARAWPAKFMLHGVAPVLELESMAIVYNTNLVKTPINSYADLLRPDLKGKIGTVGLAASAIVAWYDWLEKTQAPGYLNKLAAQQPGIYASSLPGTQSVASGEYAVITFANTGSVVPLINQGAPIRMVVPTPAFGLRYAGGIVRWSRRPNAAQVLMDYLMSVRGQSIWHGQGDSASPLPNIPKSLDAQSVAAFDYAAYPPEVVNRYTEKWNSVFKK